MIWDRSGPTSASLPQPFISTQTLSLFYPYRYEDEINRRTSAENEFVVLKKVSEVGARGRAMKGAQHTEPKQS